MFRSTGSAIGVSIASAVYQITLQSRLRGSLGDEDCTKEVIRRLVDDFDVVNQLPPEWRQPVLLSGMSGLHSVFIACFVPAIMAFSCQIFVKQHKLHSNLERK